MLSAILLRVGLASIFNVYLLVGASVPAVQAQTVENLDAFDQQINRLRTARKVTEAISLTERALALVEQLHGVNHPRSRTYLRQLAQMNATERRFSDAERYYLRAIASAERLNEQGAADAAALTLELAILYKDLKRPADAEPRYRKAVDALVALHGENHIAVQSALAQQVEFLLRQHRWVDAGAANARLMAITQHLSAPQRDSKAAAGNPTVVPAEPNPDMLTKEAIAQHNAGRYMRAAELARHALNLAERRSGTTSPVVAGPLTALAHALHAQGQYQEAEPHYVRARRVLTDLLAVLSGPMHAQVTAAVATIDNNRAVLFEETGRHTDAERLLLQVLDALEGLPDAPPSLYVSTLRNLALHYGEMGRIDEAEQLFRRATGMAEARTGVDAAMVAGVQTNLAWLLRLQGPSRLDEAIDAASRALSTAEAAPDRNRRAIADAMGNLTVLLQDAGRLDEAERTARRALEIYTQEAGPPFPALGIATSNLASILEQQHRYADAEPLYQRAIAVLKATRGPDHPDTAVLLTNLGRLYLKQSRWHDAASQLAEGTSSAERRALISDATLGRQIAGVGKSDAERLAFWFEIRVKVASRLVSIESDNQATLMAVAFQAAQYARSSQANQSLQLMATRAAARIPALAAMVRQRQDLVAEWQKRDRLSVAALARILGNDDRAEEAAHRARRIAIEQQIAVIDTRLKEDFRDYNAFANPGVMTIAEVQHLLQPQEALLLFLDTNALNPTPDETFVWLVTKTSARWLRADIGTRTLTQHVAALRCGLDADAWESVSGAAQCAGLTNRDSKPGRDDPLPFSLQHAHELYAALLGPFKHEIASKTLLIVPSGPLASLPFHVLITEPPQVAVATAWQDYGGVAWLARQHAVTTLPSVASLKALRALRPARPSAGAMTYLGYGDPILTGNPNCKPSNATGTCPVMTTQRLTAASPVRPVADASRSVERRSALLTTLYHSGRRSPDAQLSEVKALCPLPDTADEIRCVAGSLGALSEIRLGARANETDIKALDTSGGLTAYRVVHFATHGLLAGDLQTLERARAEPALVMTPPDTPTDANDDGLLTASEIAGLKLDADWVIMSACNTAGSQHVGAEALSGLARAFFYAGARSLLVSHWPVYSNAAVRLITGTFANLHDSIGRTEAHRRAMMALIDDVSDPTNVHPSVWAPFVVVGEGTVY